MVYECEIKTNLPNLPERLLIVLWLHEFISSLDLKLLVVAVFDR